MSKYTTEVRYICENYAGETESKGFGDVNEIISKSYNKIFDSSLVYFDDDYGKLLEQKILKHFYTREIGFETLGVWKLKLNTKMNELLPYYNQLYKSAMLEFKPFDDVNYTKEHKGKYDTTNDLTRTNDFTRTDNTTRTDDFTRTDNLTTTNDLTTTNTGTIDNSGTNASTEAYSDTPQGSLTGVAELNYLTNATKVDGTTGNLQTNDLTETNTGTVTNTETQGTQGTSKNTGTVKNDGTEKNTGTVKNIDEWVETLTGKTNSTSYSDLLMKYRETFLNIDLQLINELNDLFMIVY